MEYSYDGVPTEMIPELAAATQAVALENFARVITDGTYTAAEVTGGFLYRRKDEFSTHPLGKPFFYDGKERDYSKLDTDEVVLQVTVRVPRRAVEELVAQARVDFVAEYEAERVAELEAKAAERAAIDAEIAGLQARKAAI
jgi:hypothetical protein